MISVAFFQGVVRVLGVLKKCAFATHASIGDCEQCAAPALVCKSTARGQVRGWQATKKRFDKRVSRDNLSVEPELRYLI